MLKLINGTKKAPRFTQEQLAEKHYSMAITGLKAYLETSNRLDLCKCAYNAIRQSTCYRYETDKIGDSQFCEKLFSLCTSAKNVLAILTPKEIMQTFPITKIYDGKRLECADYFTTMEKFKGLAMDKPINEQVEDMTDWLWGYQNIWLQHFLVTLFSMVSKLRQFNGEDDLFTGFCKEQGIEPPETIRVYKGDKGRKYAVDSNGKAMPLRKAKPRYLKVLK
jgi:hypothetical protein